MRAGTVRTALVALVSAAVAVGSSLAPPTAEAAAPKLTVTKIAGGLSVPWDVTWVGSLMLFDQRAGGMWSKRGSAARGRCRCPCRRSSRRARAACSAWSPTRGAATNKYFYTCIAVGQQPTAGHRASRSGSGGWTPRTRATKVKVLITGIPLTSGRHSGCRLRFRSAAMLYIGTGDAAVGTNPQSLNSLGRQGAADPQRRDRSRPATRSTSGRQGQIHLELRTSQRPGADVLSGPERRSGRSSTDRPGRRGQPDLRAAATTAGRRRPATTSPDP